VSKHHHGGVTLAVAEVAKNANPSDKIVNLTGIKDLC
jgi:hypothetical protein